jgi:phosphatidylserine/phosphatidylglycerophosphate/cardiolipin synthase-like enzyme
MGLFSPNTTWKPSGALAELLFRDATQEISSAFFFEQTTHYEPQKRRDGDLIDRLDTLSKHVRALERAFEIATRRIVIVSPFISSAAIKSDKLTERVAAARQNNTQVTVYTDSQLDVKNGKLKETAREGRELLQKHGAELKVKEGIHNKALVVDDSLSIEGSFNWLSAQRDESSPYHRYEVSVVVRTGETPGFIEGLLNKLDALPSEKSVPR